MLARVGWYGAVIAFLIWLTLVLVIFDPLLRRLLRSLTGIELVRRRGTGTSLQWISVTDGRGRWIEFLWDWESLYALAGLPFAIALLVLALRWSAQHPK